MIGMGGSLLLLLVIMIVGMSVIMIGWYGWLLMMLVWVKVTVGVVSEFLDLVRMLDLKRNALILTLQSTQHWISLHSTSVYLLLDRREWSCVY